jgi:hypothetical protein
MRTILIVAAIIGFSAPAFAQTAAPKVGTKRLKVVRPPAPMGLQAFRISRGYQDTGSCRWPAPQLRHR